MDDPKDKSNCLAKTTTPEKWCWDENNALEKLEGRRWSRQHSDDLKNDEKTKTWEKTKTNLKPQKIGSRKTPVFVWAEKRKTKKATNTLQVFLFLFKFCEEEEKMKLLNSWIGNVLSI